MFVYLFKTYDTVELYHLLIKDMISYDLKTRKASLVKTIQAAVNP